MKIIAEIGSNWKTIEDCWQSIHTATAFGADAVKFQLYDAKSLWGIDEDGARKAVGSLPPEWLPKLKEHADQYKIEFMCSAFSPELYEKVNQFVSVHKIASSELNHVRILQKINRFRKPVILSTAAAIESEIKEALKYLPDCEVTLMYCVGSYPARHTYLPTITEMADKFKLPVGLSDHSIDVYTTPLGAYAYGAKVLEKHVNFTDHKDTPDAPHSLSGAEFKLMCTAIKGGGKAYIGPSPEERDMTLKHRRRLIAIKDIKAGDKFVEGKNFGIYRSLKENTKALTPFALEHVIDKHSKNDIAAGDGIGPKDI